MAKNLSLRQSDLAGQGSPGGSLGGSQINLNLGGSHAAREIFRLQSSVQKSYPLEEFPAPGLFVDGVNARGNDPDGDAPAGTEDQQIDDHFMVNGFLPQKRKEADKDPRVHEVPLEIGEAKSFRHRPGADRLQHGIFVKPFGGFVKDAVHQVSVQKVLSGLGDQAGAEVFEGGQVVKKDAACAVRHGNLYGNPAADHPAQVPAGNRLSARKVFRFGSLQAVNVRMSS